MATAGGAGGDDGGRPQTRRWTVWFLGAAVAAVVLGAVGLTRLTADEPIRYRFEGKAVRNDGAVLEAADRAFLRTAHREEASLGDGARCYFSQPRPDADLAPRLRCGPIVHFGGSAQRPWDDVDLTATAVKNGVRLERKGSSKTGQALATGELLTRPDGATPPEAKNLAPPPPPRLSPGQVVVASSTPSETTMRRVETAVLGPGDLNVRIEDLGVAPQVRTSPGLRRPSFGEELVVATINVRARGGAAMELVAGPRRAPLPEAALQGRHVIAASVPVGSEAVLEITLRGISQRVSLRTGQPVGQSVGVLTERLRVTLNRVVERQQVPFGLGRPQQPVALPRFTLVEAELLAHSDWLGTAPSGSAWLAVEVQDFSVPTAPDAVAVRLNVAASFSVLLADGRSVPATEFGAPPGGRTVYIPVPEAFRAGVVTITPTFHVEAAGATATLAYPSTEVVLELRPSPAVEDRQNRH
ncbi:MAG: hypothetical protein M3203_10910 [Actinomycetota bacterium]|nr:hypothetical protein [Actinomycetota bacterium]